MKVTSYRLVKAYTGFWQTQKKKWGRERTIFVRESQKREQNHNTKGQIKKKTSFFLFFFFFQMTILASIFKCFVASHFMALLLRQSAKKLSSFHIDISVTHASQASC